MFTLEIVNLCDLVRSETGWSNNHDGENEISL